jgi:ABC-2 type transport system ATP-binding protein
MDSTLAEMEKKLEIYGFYRCHRSYIVNLQKVREIITWSKNAYSLRIDNKDKATIPLSRTKIQDIQEKFNLE